MDGDIRMIEKNSYLIVVILAISAIELGVSLRSPDLSWFLLPASLFTFGLAMKLR